MAGAAAVSCSVIFSVEDFSGSEAQQSADGGVEAQAEADVVAESDVVDAGESDAYAEVLLDACSWDLTTDNLNCGTCGHSCMGGDCVAGVCQPVALASGQSCPMGISVQDQVVYWTNSVPASGAVMRVLSPGDAPEVIAEDYVNPVAIALDETSVFWAVQGTLDGDGFVLRLDKADIGYGVAPTVLVQAQTVTGLIALSATDVYYASKSTIRRVPKTAQYAMDEEIATTDKSGGLAFSLSALDRAVYWTDYGIGSISRLPVNDSGLELMVSGQPQPAAVAVDEFTIYWTNMGDGEGGLPAVMKAGKLDPIGSTQVLDQANAGALPFALVESGPHVYWTDAMGGTVKRVPKATGSPETLASGQGGPRGLAVVGGVVYWANCTAGTVMALVL
jgi:hypothetical protein